jgi:PPOX class probable F420-dependent enzyme
VPDLELSAMRGLVEAAQVARLATVDATGRPHLVPVCFVVRLDPAGRPNADLVWIAVDHKPKRSTELRRTANLRATGSACLLIDRYTEDWSQLWWVRLDGHGRVLDNPAEASTAKAAEAALAAKYPQYREQPPAGPVLEIRIERYRGWSATELDTPAAELADPGN